MGEFVLPLSSYCREHSLLHPFIDETHCCARPATCLINATMFNHTCHGETIHPRESHGCALPSAIAYAPAGLPAGSLLLWNYNDSLPSRAVTVGRRGLAELQADGYELVPCACCCILACPRSCWFRIFPRL